LMVLHPQRLRKEVEHNGNESRHENDADAAQR